MSTQIQVNETNPAAQGRDEIFLLPSSLLDSHAAMVKEFLAISSTLKLPLGWHYLLDLAWAAERIQSSIGPGSTILDAGAGYGLMQFWLVDHGYNVISVDRVPRYFPRRIRSWCPIVEFDSKKQASTRRDALRLVARGVSERSLSPRQIVRAAEAILRGDPEPGDRAQIQFMEGNLLDLHQIDSGSIDAIVSISALEHNPPDDLQAVVGELLRILRTEGQIVATLGASKESDWYHKPSNGWCYTEKTLQERFQLDQECPSNYSNYDSLFDDLIDCAYLKRNLSELYFRSGANGMPWGRWQPKYMSVGVLKVKQ